MKSKKKFYLLGMIILLLIFNVYIYNQSYEIILYNKEHKGDWHSCPGMFP